MKTKKLLILAACSLMAACATTPPPAPYGVVPTPAQVAWQQMEMNMFVHFGPNTFTNSEWGNGRESADIFNPTDLDCRQWAATARAAGMKGVILTAKHHDGFCLWPNPVSSHTVAQSSWRNGEGDVLKELSEACAAEGLKFGIYISPWDRNAPEYGTEEYNEVFRCTLESALGSYGPVYEQWFDGACGEGPNGKRQVYDWKLYHAEVYKHQPDAIIFSDIGPGCRWIGNEEGSAGRTCWSRLDTVGFAPGKSPALDTLNCGNRRGEAWVPGEVDVSIRPGWFYRASEDAEVKSLAQLLHIYYESVGRNSLLLLNVPADQRGRLCAVDSLRLMELHAALEALYAVNHADGATIEASNVRGGSRRYAAENLLNDRYDSYWATDDETTTATLTLTLPAERTFNRLILQEYIPLGQRVARFHVDYRDEAGEWHELAQETTIGYKRILTFNRTTATALRVVIDEADACPVLNRLSLHTDDAMIDAPTVERDKSGRTTLSLREGTGEIYYTLDGSTPNAASTCYTVPIDLPNPAHLRAVAVVDGRMGDPLNAWFDLAPSRFTTRPAEAAAAVDGLTSDGAVIPADTPLTIDFGEALTLNGFAYEPMARGREGVLIDYTVDISKNGHQWERVAASSFDNIVNNPIRRTCRFEQPVTGRYLRLTAERTNADGGYGVAEISVLTR